MPQNDNIYYKEKKWSDVIRKWQTSMQWGDQGWMKLVTLQKIIIFKLYQPYQVIVM